MTDAERLWRREMRLQAELARVLGARLSWPVANVSTPCANSNRLEQQLLAAMRRAVATKQVDGVSG